MRERVETFALELQDEFELRILEFKKYAVYYWMHPFKDIAIRTKVIFT